MYDRDMPIIKAHALASPEGTADVITFALLTIRQHLVLVGPAFEDVKRTGRKSTFLLGDKRKGYAYTQAHKEVLHGALVAAVKANDPVGAIDVLLNVPCLGLVKAAFVAQMIGLEAGCFDTHNQNRLGLTYQDVRFRKSCIRKPETRRRKIVEYLARVADHGGARKLWNDWCAYVANPEARGARYSRGIFVANRNPADVSALHWRSMGLQLPEDACPF